MFGELVTKVMKWWLSSGPGSPGETSRLVTQMFLSSLEQFAFRSRKEHFNYLLSRRKDAFDTGKIAGIKNTALYDRIDFEDVIDYCQSDLRLLIFQILMIESQQMRDLIELGGPNTNTAVFALIDEVVEKNSSSGATLSLEKFCEKAFERKTFLNVFRT